jgi:hypothetical protein
MNPTRRLLAALCVSFLLCLTALFAESPANLKTLPPAVYSQLAKLTGSDTVPGSDFSYSVAVSSDGNTIVVGAYGNEANNAAYVFVKPSTGWANATQTAELTPSDGEPGNPFGISVAISGNTIFVGSRIPTLVTDYDYTYGAIYAFTEPTGGWVSMTETAKLTVTSNCNCSIGNYIAAGGNSVVTSAISRNSEGAVGLYLWNKGAAGWAKGAPAASLTTSDTSTNWDSIAMSTTGNTIAAGNGSLVYVYAKPMGGWKGTGLMQTAQLITSDGGLSDYLGASVATTDTTVAAGAFGRNDYQGAVYVYVKPSGGWVNAEENAQLSAADGPYLGASVGISGNTIVAGSPYANVNGIYQAGAAFIYNKPSSGWKSTSQFAEEIFASDAVEESAFANTLAFGGTTIVAGAQNFQFNNENPQTGEAYVFGQ